MLCMQHRYLLWLSRVEIWYQWHFLVWKEENAEGRGEGVSNHWRWCRASRPSEQDIDSFLTLGSKEEWGDCRGRAPHSQGTSLWSSQSKRKSSPWASAKAGFPFLHVYAHPHFTTWKTESLLNAYPENPQKGPLAACKCVLSSPAPDTDELYPEPLKRVSLWNM